MAGTLASRSAARRLAQYLLHYSKKLATQALESGESAAIISSHEGRVLTTLRLRSTRISSIRSLVL